MNKEEGNSINNIEEPLFIEMMRRGSKKEEIEMKYGIYRGTLQNYVTCTNTSLFHPIGKPQYSIYEKTDIMVLDRVKKIIQAMNAGRLSEKKGLRLIDSL